MMERGGHLMRNPTSGLTASRSGSGEAWILDVGSPGQRAGLLAICGKRDFGDFETCHNLSIFDIWHINHTFDTNRIDSFTS